MADNNIILVRGDDSNFLNQVLLVIYFKTNLNLDNYKMRFTIENPTNLMKTFEVINNAVEINLDKILTSTLEVGIHKCNIKLIDTLNRVKTVKNFDIKIENEFNSEYIYPNEYEVEVQLDDGINKYKNYNELIFKPSINGVVLEGDKNFDELGITKHMIGISNEGIKRHNEDPKSHQYLQDQIFNKQDRLIAGSNITIINGIISALGDNGGVTTDYKELGNKPKINNIVLDGDLSLDELGIQPKGEYIDEETLNAKGFLTTVPTGYITEQELEEKGFLTEIPDIYFTDEQNLEKYFTKEKAQNKQDKLIAGENIIIEEDNTIKSIIPPNYVTEEKLDELNYTTDEKLNTLLNRKQNTILAGDNIKLYQNIDGTYTISALSPKDQAVINSYNALKNLPTINNVLLVGNKTLDELDIQPKGEYQHILTAGDNIEITEDENNNTIIKANIPDNICTDLELTAGLMTKADKSDTLEGYGITDAYTKIEIEQHFNEDLKRKITDIIIDAPNGVAEYTEQTLTAKNGLTILYSNGLKNNFYKNIELTLENDITTNISEIDFDDIYKEFYLALLYKNEQFTLKVYPKELFNVINYEVIPNTQQGYIKNLADNKFYQMVYQGHGIYQPSQIITKIIGSGTSIADENGKIKITSFIPYSSYRLVNQDELFQQTKNLQTKLSFGENFEVINNQVSYKLPFNVVTKEFLIENDYVTQVNINDAVNIHNTNSNSHQDIRQEIKNIKPTKISQLINDSQFITHENMQDYVRGQLQHYAEITDIPDAREFVIHDDFNNLVKKVEELQAQIENILNNK